MELELKNVYSNPNLYINLVSQENLDGSKLLDGTYDLGKLKPTLAKSDIQCSFYGEELCVISGKEILEKNAQLILVGVFCKEQCSFKLKSDLEVEVNLKPGKMHQVYFDEFQQRIFRFQIPQDDSIETIEIRGISDSKFGQFEMLVLQGNEVPSSSNALILQPAWENGYIGKFEKMSWEFCTGCNYTVLISAKTAGYLTIGAKVSNATIDLNSFKDGETYDYVHFWGLQCYSYFVSDPHKPFTIKVQSYGGTPLIYVNPLQELDKSNFQKALFNSKDHFQNEELVLDFELREKFNAVIGMYYICIYGLTSTSYKISAKNIDHSNMLKAGLLESGYIEPNQIKEFYFTDKVLRDDSIKIQLKTNVMVGSVRIKSKICPRSSADITESISECYFTPKEMNEEEENENIFQNSNTLSELPQHDICAPDKFYISQDLGKRKDGEAGCIFVFGVLGLSNYTSHFSVMLQLEGGQGKSHPLILSQGVPDFQQIKRDEKQYYQITVEDPDIQKLTVLLTTIHGDPDLFISTTSTTPSEKNFEWASYNAGLYPDMIVIKKSETDDNKLTNNYYVAVQSVEESTYSLVFYTHNSKNQAGIQKLLVGKKQRGVLHLPDNITETIKNESFVISKEVQVGEDFAPEKSEELPSLIYHFQVPAIQLARGKVVRISLNVENGGDLMYLVKANSVPQLALNYKNITDDQWVGNNYKDVLIKLEELDKELKQEVTDSQNTTNQTQLIDFYIRIYPRTIFVFDPENKNKQPIVFTISFYDEEQFIHLADGIPYRGALNSQEPDYFYFDIQDLNVDYEISLNTISGGNSDLHLTLDPKNKYMSNQKSMLTSANRFTTDSIILTKEMISHAIEQGYGINIGEKQIKQILQVYIQVNTSEVLSVYSILFTKLSEFNAIQLTLGQVQQGSVKPNEKKIYFLTAHSSSSSKPIRIDLYPSNGKPEIEVTVLTNQQFSQQELSSLLKKPTFKQKMVRGEETLLIDLNKDEKLQCKENCVIVISISDKSLDQSKLVQSHFRLQVSQDFQELIDGESVQGQIKILQQNCTHFGQYMFYRFYKPCDVECDFVLRITPDQILENVLSVLVNFEDPSYLANGEQTPLPTWQSKPTWSIGIKSPTVITIEGTEPYFQERTQSVSSSGKVLDSEQIRSSIGYFIIGIQSYADVSFKIQGGTVPSDQDSGEKMIDIQQLYVGVQQRAVYLKPGQSKYFFFRNWREESITFSLDFQTQNMFDNVLMSVSQLEQGDSKSGHGSGGRIPKTLKELESRIIQDFEPLVGEFIEIEQDSDYFCFMCMYIVKVINMNEITNTTDGDAKFNIEVQQSLDDLSDEVINQHEGTYLQSFLQIGRPQPLNLQKYDKIKLQFQTSQEVKIELETRLGSVQVRLERDYDGKILQNYTQFRKTLIQLNISQQDLKGIIQDQDDEVWIDSLTKFNLIVTADSNDFEGSVLVRDPNTLSILPDGKSIDLYFDYRGDKTKGVKRNGRYHQTQYFMLLPSSHNMDLQIQAGLKTFSSQQGTFNSENSLIQNGQTSLREQLLDPEFFHFKASFKKIETMENLKNSNVKWTEEFTEDEQFDEVIESSDANIYSQIFTRLHYESNPETDLILVKFDGSFSPKHSKGIDLSELVYRFRVTSSDISYLKVYEEIRAAVVDDSTRFKIFELNINPLDFPEDENLEDENTSGSKVDLFIQLTPCTGNLKYFLSDNLEDLFLEEQALVYSMLSPIMITNRTVKKGNDDRQYLEIIHKNSKIQQSFAKTQNSNLGLLQSDDTDKSIDYIYLDQFGMQGKRLKNIQKFKNTKIYIGVRALSSVEQNQKQNEIQKIYEHQSDLSNLKRRKRIYQKLPSYGTYLSSDKDVATFRISSYYLLDDQLDVLDRYDLSDPAYGIIFEPAGRDKIGKVKISWSPIISYNMTENSSQNLVMTNITYKLLFAYSFDAAQIFQSICEVQFIQSYLEEKRENSLKLEDKNDRHLKSCGSRILENQSLLDNIEKNLTQMTVKNDNYLEVLPDGKLDKIKSIIIIAEIEEYNEDLGWDMIYLPYSPVNFDKPIQLVIRYHRWAKILIIAFIITSLVLVIFLIAFCQLRKRNSASDSKINHGIALSNIQIPHQQNDTQVSIDSSKKTTIEDSERKNIIGEQDTVQSSVLDDTPNKNITGTSIEF